MEEFNPEDFIVLGKGHVEYDAEKAAVLIDDLIAALNGAKSEGATHVLMFSGNYRGARYASLGTTYEWLSDRDEWDE